MWTKVVDGELEKRVFSSVRVFVVFSDDDSTMRVLRLVVHLLFRFTFRVEEVELVELWWVP